MARLVVHLVVAQGCYWVGRLGPWTDGKCDMQSFWHACTRKRKGELVGVAVCGGGMQALAGVAVCQLVKDAEQ